MATLTTTSMAGLGMGLGSKAGFVDGFWYVLWSNGTNIYYAATDDPTCLPSTFGSSTVVKAGSDGSYFQAIFDGIYCHLFSCTPGSNPIKYRRGTCSGGMISWDTEVTAVTGSQMRVTSVDITSDGHLLVAYYADNGAYVSRNDNTDGTWSTTSGYPKRLDDADSVNHYVKVLDLGGGAWIGLYCGVTGGHVYARAWNGSTLAAKEQCTDVIASATDRWDARAYGSTVYLAWNGQPGNFSLYRRTRTSGSWGTTVTLETMSGSDYDNVPAVSVNKDLGDVFVSWQNYPSSSHVYYVKYTALTSSWGSVVDADNETLTNPYQIVGLSRAFNDSVLFFYLTQSTSPYQVHNFRVESLTASAGGAGPSGGIGYGGIMII